MTFLRLKTDSAGRVYLYEEERHREAGKVKSISRSHGRVHGFWFAVACLLGDIFQTKVNGYDPDEAERQALEVQQRQREADEKKMWEVTHPQWGVSYEERATLQGAPAAPQPTPDTMPDVPSQNDASPPEPGQPSGPEPDAASAS